MSPVIQLANAPCSWGVLEFEGLGAPSPSYQQVLDEMSSAGYRGTELGDWEFMPTNPDQLAEQLRGRDLELVGAFQPVALSNPNALNQGLGDALRTARLLAAVNPAAFLVLSDDNGSVAERARNAGRIGPQQAMSDAQWATFAASTDAVARQVAGETGIRTVFHHHCAGYIETPDEIARLMDRTDPGLVGLCLDTGHCVYGGGDPADVITRFGDRIWHVHFKDCSGPIARRARAEQLDYLAAVGLGIFCELGSGDVDFAAVLAQLTERDYRGWVVVEQDVLPGMGAPRECAIRNRTFLTGLGL